MQIIVNEQTGRVSWLRRKHYARKITQEGYRRPADNGDGNRKRNKKKMPDKIKAMILASQPKMVMHMGPTGKCRMVRLDKD